jgi:hypothetical protein
LLAGPKKKKGGSANSFKEHDKDYGPDGLKIPKGQVPKQRPTASKTIEEYSKQEHYNGGLQ